MLYTELTKKALGLCVHAHEGQKDKAGMPYILHPIIVAEHVEGEYATCVALLHDVVEDTPLTLDDLRKEGMPEEVVSAVGLMSHKPCTPYMDYVAAIKSNPLARIVKLADLAHNMDLGRLDKVTEADLQRIDKYRKAHALLTSEE